MKSSRIVLIAILLAAAGYAGAFYYKNLRGAWPALRKPSQDITELLRHPKRIEGSRGSQEGGDSSAPPQNDTDMPLKLPSGFSISVFAKDLGKPRVVIADPAGYLLVSIPSQGKIVALVGEVGSSLAENPHHFTLLEGLNRPHGMAIRCFGEGEDRKAPCELFVAESHQISAYDYGYSWPIPSATDRRKVINLPDGGNHVTRTLIFSPGDRNTLLASVGSSCNVCHERDTRRAAVLAVHVDSGEAKLFALGLRNSVFLTRHPITRKIWATEMGRDLLGDDLPPDEINIIDPILSSRASPDDPFEASRGIPEFGWPYCYGKQVHDANFDPRGVKKEFCKTTVPSHIDIPAHSAPLGLAFVPPDSSWPKEYWYNLLVAYHGSWNRSVPTGYKIVRYKLDQDGNYLGEEDFITGWLRRSDQGSEVGVPTEASGLTPYEVLGRPVDILIQPNGVMYISDDKAGVIYRVEYHGK